MQQAKSKTAFSDAKRVHTAITAKAERRLLEWMARRTPAAIGSDHLTAMGFVAQILAGISYGLAGRDVRALWLVNVFLFLNWLGDSLDGTLARIRHQQRPRYGFYVDHVADTLGAAALMAGLGFSGYVHWPVAAMMLLCFYVLAIESYLATYTIGRFHLSHGLFGPTELRLLLMAGNLFLMAHKNAHIGGREFLLFDAGGVVAVGGMSAMALIAMMRHTLWLYREERVV